MNKFNTLHDDKLIDPPRDWTSQPPSAHFKYMTSTPKTSPLISAVMGRLNHHYIDNGDVEVQPSEFPA